MAQRSGKKCIYAEAVEVFGYRYQLRKLQEELSELAGAINRFIDRRPKGRMQMHEEFIDVEILMRQIKNKLDPMLLKGNEEYKLKRLRKRIRNKKYKEKIKARRLGKLK